MDVMRRLALIPLTVSKSSGNDRRGPEWISKTDLTTYVRCPYAFWLLHQGRITRDQLVDEHQARLLSEGIAFEASVDADAPTVTGPLSTLLSRNITLLRTPLFENRRLKIYGRPDGIDAARGALLPIEIKSHKRVQHTDKLELAFYWLLLEPDRKRRLHEPRGVLLLRRDGEAERVDVDISPYDLERVLDLLGEIRRARAEGVRPRICGCNVCSRVVREEVLRETSRNADLTRIFDISRRRARLLEGLGVRTWKHLLDGDAGELVMRLRSRKHYVSTGQVERWQHHARAYAKLGPVFFGEEWPVGQRFVALDLEYCQGRDGLVWLIGGAVVDGRESTCFSFWADTPKQERIALRGLATILDRHRDAPIVTWSGNSADIPNLRHADGRARGSVLQAVVDRHLDLYQYVAKSFRFPFPNLGLKDVASFLGIPRLSGITDGLDALGRYEQYRHTRSTRKKRDLRAELEDYNQDDVRCLVAIVERLRDLAASLPRFRSAPPTTRRGVTLDSGQDRTQQHASAVGRCGACEEPIRHGRLKCDCGWILRGDPFDMLERDDVLPRQRQVIEMELRAVAQTGPKRPGESADAYSRRVVETFKAMTLNG